MPTYTTPTPTDVAIDLQAGRIDVVAGDRADTVVTVSATNPAKAVDRRGAEQTRVEFDGERVTVVGPKPRLSVIGTTESVDVTVELPTGSRFTAEIAYGALRTVGRLGNTRVKSSTGTVELDTTGDLWLRAGHGNVTLAAADGGIEITADHGQIRVGTVTGDAVLKASHGSVRIEESGGNVDAKLSYGDLEITRALASVAAKTAYGGIALREVSSGSVQVESGYGQIDIGVRPGVPAWLDLAAKNGRVRNELDGDSAPAGAERAVEVRARTKASDITVQRARAVGTSGGGGT